MISIISLLYLKLYKHFSYSTVVFSLMNKVGATYEGLPRKPRSSLLGPTRDTLGKLLLLLLLKTKGGSIIGYLQGKLLLLLLITGLPRFC
jgi:hypothetical protein